MKKIMKLIASILFGFVATSIMYFSGSCFGNCNRSFTIFVETIYIYIYVVIFGLIFYGVITFFERQRLKNPKKKSEKEPIPQ